MQPNGDLTAKTTTHQTTFVFKPRTPKKTSESTELEMAERCARLFQIMWPRTWSISVLQVRVEEIQPSLTTVRSSFEDCPRDLQFSQILIDTSTVPCHRSMRFFAQQLAVHPMSIISPRTNMTIIYFVIRNWSPRTSSPNPSRRKWITGISIWRRI